MVQAIRFSKDYWLCGVCGGEFKNEEAAMRCQLDKKNCLGE